MVLTKPERILDVERIFRETTTLLSQHRTSRMKKKNDDNAIDSAAPALRSIFDSLYKNLALISPDNNNNNRNSKRSLVSDVRQLALNLNEKILSKNIESIEEAINAKLLKELVSDVKLAYNVTNAIDSSSNLKSLGNVLRKGFIDASVSEDMEIFKRSSILSRYMLLDERCQLFPISAETKELLLEGSSQAATARAILSESNQLLTDAVMYNTRDTPVEKAVDRVLLLPYLVKQGRDFDDVDRTLPVAITNCSSLMLSLLDSQSMSRSPFLGGLMGHVTDTTSVFKNIERFERLSGRLGDVASMLHHQNCNCPFKFHHCSDRTEEENLMPSFIHFEDEIDKCEISKTPYQVHVLMAIKNYVANISRIDPSVGGPSVIRRLREWSDMGAGTRYIGSFIADRKTVQDSPFRVAGSNLDVIVRPAAAREQRLANVEAPHLSDMNVDNAADNGRPSACENRSFGSQIRNEISRMIWYRNHRRRTRLIQRPETLRLTAVGYPFSTIPNTTAEPPPPPPLLIAVAIGYGDRPHGKIWPRSTFGIF
ncbi:hypothetical protein C7M84_019658 [Penaeus vannamei]|uniref:Uncharacterized protein n=1 Tax=Penaeus vannamei TaxID=6689 RepID=A0A423SE63_PENVA|nr:hypothetical protein C7M84_019658 [Penaeus vannamei]